ncbi:hypothetical protein MRB53_037385 [Persea americana]|nr:hypothetical protein MRB53_037385 [Persea americana]
MKAYRDSQGSLRLFRPDRNMARMNGTGARIALPSFAGEQWIECIKRLVRRTSASYLGQGVQPVYPPTHIGTQRTLGVGPPSSSLLYVIASPVGPYYPTGFKAIGLKATADVVRAWPGGTGDKKLGGNYAPCVVPQMQAAQEGLAQNLWLFREFDRTTGLEEELVTEVGTMNLFAALQRKDGKMELVTAPLDGTILAGVTRDSILTLARERLAPKGWIVSERKFSMRELAEAEGEGRLKEVFGAGTAAIVSPVRNINWKGRNVDCALNANNEAGEITTQMKAWIEEIQYGDVEHPWSVKI